MVEKWFIRSPLLYIMDDFARHVSSLSSLGFVPLHLCGPILFIFRQYYAFCGVKNDVAHPFLLFMVAGWSIRKCYFNLLQLIFVCASEELADAWFRVRCLHQSCVLHNLYLIACWKNMSCICLNRMGSNCLRILHVVFAGLGSSKLGVQDQVVSLIILLTMSLPNLVFWVN